MIHEKLDNILKRKLCNNLIENNKVKLYDVVNHSYTNGLCGKNPNSRQTLDDFIESDSGIMPTLTTRPDCLGVVVKECDNLHKPINITEYKNYYQWYEKGYLESECRAWKDDNFCGTITTTNKTKIGSGETHGVVVGNKFTDLD